MRICHLSAFNGSGMHAVAKTMATAERKLGLDSRLVNAHEAPNWDEHADCDIYVTHTHFPTELKKRITKPFKLVFVGHGTPEYVFSSSVEEAKKGYGHGDGWMLFQYWMQHADAIVTFWPRHWAIMKSMCDKNTPVHLAPLGIELDFWSGGTSQGKWSGRPSVMSCENSHFIKWSYDLLIAWPWVLEQVPDACLHLNYLPVDQHRWFFPLVNRNGSSYGAHISATQWNHDLLRNHLKSIDLYCGLVRYGDHNRISLEAAAAGAKVISYRGNPYSDYWVDEGDQRTIAEQLIAILKHEVEPRANKLPVPDASEMAQAMKGVYESIQ